MSRHRDVRNLDYDELLDDEAGGNDMSPAEIERLDQAVDAITARLGSGFSMSEVKDAAWYYYFDVDQSTNYLLEQHAKKEEKRLKAKSQSEKGTYISQPFEGTVSAPRDLSVSRDGSTEIQVRSPSPSMEASSLHTKNTASSDEGTQAKPKKLSKLQQLIKSKAAAKNAAAQSGPSHGSAPKLANSLEKLRIEKARRSDPVVVNPSSNIVVENPPHETHAVSKVQDEPEFESDQATREIFQRKLDATELALPSTFATTLLGALESSSGSERNHADRVFSCFTVSSAKKVSNVQRVFAQPSPDDVVQQAQSMSKGMIKGKVQNASKVTEASGPDAEKLPDTKSVNQPRKGRPPQATTKYISLVVIGHVDAGKSTLFGRLLYDLGNIDERSMQRLKRDSEKMQKSSFAFAWAMDSGTEERERGVTIDIATNTFESDSTVFTILDAPGHKDFVPNMIAGASQADFAIMVIDASTGAFESGFDAAGQTKEHAILVRSLGIQRVIVAVNKLDNVHWSQSRFRDIEVQMTTFMKHTGFEESALSFVPCSGLSGENVAKPINEDVCDWYRGKSLLQEMNMVEALSRDETAPFRMIISDVQATPNSSNVTLMGRISSGELQKDDTVLCMPSKEPARVKSLISGEETETAFAGDNTTLTLADIDPIHLRVGDILCHATNPVPISTSFKARMVTFPMLRPLLTGSSVVLHRGRADLPAIIRKIEVPDKSKPGQFKTARHVIGASQAVMTIELVRGVIPLETFHANKDLGRVIVRREGDTVCAGVVLEVS